MHRTKKTKIIYLSIASSLILLFICYYYDIKTQKVIWIRRIRNYASSGLISNYEKYVEIVVSSVVRRKEKNSDGIFRRSALMVVGNRGTFRRRIEAFSERLTRIRYRMVVGGWERRITENWRRRLAESESTAERGKEFTRGRRTNSELAEEGFTTRRRTISESSAEGEEFTMKRRRMDSESVSKGEEFTWWRTIGVSASEGEEFTKSWRMNSDSAEGEEFTRRRTNSESYEEEFTRQRTNSVSEEDEFMRRRTNSESSEEEEFTRRRTNNESVEEFIRGLTNSDLAEGEKFTKGRTNSESSDTIELVWGGDDDYLLRLANYKNVLIVVLPWYKESRTSWSNWTSMGDQSNVLVRNYHAWIGSRELCQLIRTPSLLKHRYDAMFNRTCETDMRKSIPNESLDFLYYHIKPYYDDSPPLSVNSNNRTISSLPTYYYRMPPVDLFSLAIFNDALVDGYGNIILTGQHLVFVPSSCFDPSEFHLPRFYFGLTTFDEVFVLTQQWGEDYFHKMIEMLPRIAAYVNFLKAAPTVKIHLPSSGDKRDSELLGILGIDSGRIVWGNTKAKIAYVPKSTPCGNSNAQNVQLLSLLYRNYIEKHLTASRGVVFFGGRKKTILLIERTVKRGFKNHEEIELVLRNISRIYNYEFVIFTDNPIPSLNDTMSLFNSATIIVTPHGAGLSNILFSRPDTLIIEVVCNPPQVNLCYTITAHQLGMRYHALLSDGGCPSSIDIGVRVVERTVVGYIEMLKGGGMF